MQDVMKLYIFALILEVAIFIPYCLKALQFQQSVANMLLHLADALVHAAPPGLPAIMLFCGFFSMVRLAKKGTQVFPPILRLREGSKITVACFDKTGTLTGSAVGSPVCLPACLSGLPACMSTIFTFVTCVFMCITSMRFLAFSP